MNTEPDPTEPDPIEADSIEADSIDNAERNARIVHEYNREQVAVKTAALRALADWMDANVDVTYSIWLPDIYWHCRDHDEWRARNRAMGTFTKQYNDHDLDAIKNFGGQFELRNYIPRQNSCEARVVGQRTVVKKVVPDDIKLVETEVVEDIVEWVCPDSWR